MRQPDPLALALALALVSHSSLENFVNKTFFALLAGAALTVPTFAYAEKAYLEITLKVDPQDRAAAGAIYAKYKQPFLTKVPGAKSKELLIRDDDVQVLHGCKRPANSSCPSPERV